MQGSLLGVQRQCGNHCVGKLLHRSSALDLRPAPRGQVQRSWLDDVADAASGAYDAAAGTASAGYEAVSSATSETYEQAKTSASGAYDEAKSAVSGVYEGAKTAASGFYERVSSTAGAGAAAVSEGVKTAAASVASAGHGVSAYVAGVADTLSPDAEATRARLLGQVTAARQEAQAADPASLSADASRIGALNQQVSGLNTLLASAAIPLVPVLAPEAPALGAGLLAVLEAIAVALGISVGWLIIIIAVVVLAIIALILYLLRDTKQFPDTEPVTDPKTDPKTKPKEEPDPKKRPKPDDPPPPLPDRTRRVPDCCQGAFTSQQVRIDKRHRRYGAKTITVHDGRGKHWRNTTPNGPEASCDVDFLATAARGNPSEVGPCLQAWIGAVATRNADYGGQLGSDSAPARASIVKDIVENGQEINPTRYWGDAGIPVGVDIATGNVTTKARVDDLPNKAHVIPQESRPT